MGDTRFTGILIKWVHAIHWFTHILIQIVYTYGCHIKYVPLCRMEYNSRLFTKFCYFLLVWIIINETDLPYFPISQKICTTTHLYFIHPSLNYCMFTYQSPDREGMYSIINAHNLSQSQNALYRAPKCSVLGAEMHRAMLWLTDTYYYRYQWILYVYQ